MSSNKVQKTPHRGRKKGVLNRKTEHIFEICDRHKFDPIEILIYVSKNDWESLGYDSAECEKIGLGGVVAKEDRITLTLRVDAAKKLCEFMYPKRKAIEISGNDDENPVTLAYLPKSKREVIE